MLQVARLCTLPGSAYRSQMLKWASSPRQQVASDRHPECHFRGKTEGEGGGVQSGRWPQASLACMALTVHLWAHLSQLCISPCPPGSSGTAVMLASSALDAEFLLGAPEGCPVRGVSAKTVDNRGSRAWGPPLHSCLSQETLMSLFASHSCRTRTEGLWGSPACLSLLGT